MREMERSAARNGPGFSLLYFAFAFFSERLDKASQNAISYNQILNALLAYFTFPNRCHSSSILDSSSYEERKVSKQLEDLTLDELEVIATLGMGGFGRVELVIAFLHAFSFLHWQDVNVSKSLQNRLISLR